MKHFAIITLLLLAVSSSCNKKNDTDDCTGVIITQTGTACSSWGIKVNGVTYPSSNIPAEFQREGASACASYNLYEDMRLCACCGGTWANIKSMKPFIR
jgi:hypothetical protein